MDVHVSNLAWMKKEDLTEDQIKFLKSQMTIYPKQFRPDEKEEPPKLELFKETPTSLGIARAYFESRKKPHHNVRYDLADGDPTVFKKWPVEFKGTLRPQQIPVVEEILTKLNNGALGGLVNLATGFGKTVISNYLITQIKKPTLVIVHKEFLMDQWLGEINKFIPQARVGKVQQNICEYKDKHIVLAMMQTLASREYSKEFYDNFGVVLTDECVDGKALINTDIGLLPLEDIVNKNLARQALSYNETKKQFEYKNITNRWNKGLKNILCIKMKSGQTLKVTPEHKFLTTEGWKEAKALKFGTAVIAYAPAAAENAHLSQLNTKTESMCLDTENSVIRFKKKQELQLKSKNILKDLRNEITKLHSVPAIAVKNYEYHCRKLEIKGWGAQNGANMYRGIQPKKGTQKEYLRQSMGSFMELCSEILALDTHIKEVKIHDWHSVIVLHKKNGQNIKNIGSKVYDLFINILQKTGMQKSQQLDILQKIMKILTNVLNCAKKIRKLKKFHENGSTKFQKRVWLGGTWMMEVFKKEELFCIQKVFQKLKLQLLKYGCKNSDILQQLHQQEINILLLILQQSLRYVGLIIYQNMLYQQCNINLITHLCAELSKVQTVESVIEMQELCNVYDLEVEDNHNFVANGMVVHNCHHIGSDSWSRNISKFRSRLIVGVSATLKRGDGAENAFYYLMGPILAKAEFLPMIPKIRKVFTDFHLVKTSKFNPSLVSETIIMRFICSNTSRNEQIIEQVLQALQAGRKILVASCRIKHLKVLKAMFDNTWKKKFPNTAIPANNFCIGGVKEEEIQEAAKGRIIWGSNQYLSEGFNVPALDTLILTTPASDVEQIVGRITRLVEGKKDPVVVDFRDDMVSLCKSRADFRDVIYERLCKSGN